MAIASVGAPGMVTVGPARVCVCVSTSLGLTLTNRFVRIEAQRRSSATSTWSLPRVGVASCSTPRIMAWRSLWERVGRVPRLAARCEHAQFGRRLSRTVLSHRAGRPPSLVAQGPARQASQLAALWPDGACCSLERARRNRPVARVCMHNIQELGMHLQRVRTWQHSSRNRGKSAACPKLRRCASCRWLRRHVACGGPCRNISLTRSFPGMASPSAWRVCPQLGKLHRRSTTRSPPCESGQSRVNKPSQQECPQQKCHRESMACHFGTLSLC